MRQSGLVQMVDEESGSSSPGKPGGHRWFGNPNSISVD